MNNDKPHTIRVRFAPSPTGIPHIGNTRTALFNYLFARASGGKFILRIEDTDQKRIVKGAEEAILEILEWLGIKPDGSVVHQSDRLKIYNEHVKELIDGKKAYEKEGAVWVKVPHERRFGWTDGVGNKKISFLGKDVDEFVILKSDGFPTYHLANVVDDHLMGITHVIRGEEWISSTPKHIYLYEALGWKDNMPEFAHLPVILGPDHTKLSKRHGAKSVLDYRSEGFLKEALINFMVLLGWNPGGEKEQFSLSELEKIFSLKQINTANPVFDIKKLAWINGVWIRELGENDFEKRLREFYSRDNEVSDVLDNKTTKGVLLAAAKSRMKTLADFKPLVSEKESKREYTIKEIKIAGQLLEHLKNELGDNWTEERLINSLRKFNKEKDVPFKTIYFVLTGKDQGLPLGELLKIRHKDFFINNLKSE